MASLAEELMTVLRAEATLYEQLIPIAEKKTKFIIDNDLQGLQELTDQEQELVDGVTVLENKRLEVIRNMAIVLSKKPEELKVVDIIECLNRQPEEQRELSILHDCLKQSIQMLMEINSRNKSLIMQSLEMIEFNMNFIQSTRMSPGNNNYTRVGMNHAQETSQTGMFDAKQ